MGDRNHLHVCRHCGIVHATASATPPESCAVCEAITFSASELNALLRARDGSGSQSDGADDGRAARRASPLVRS